MSSRLPLLHGNIIVFLQHGFKEPNLTEIGSSCHLQCYTITQCLSFVLLIPTVKCKMTDLSHSKTHAHIKTTMNGIDLYHVPAMLSPQRIESFVSTRLNSFSRFSLRG